MLSDNDAVATVAVKSLDSARKFDQQTLGLTKIMENEEVLAFTSGKSTLFVYRSQYAGTNKATAVTWVDPGHRGHRDDAERSRRQLRTLRLAEHDPPGRPSRGGHDEDGLVQGPDGNIFGLVTPPNPASRHTVGASAQSTA